jgi:hypothetical protein
MVAYAPYVAGTAALSTLGGYNVTSTVKPAEFCQIATVTVYEYASEATATPTTNPHGHGGPYNNPYDDIPLPYEWPGKPCNGESYPPPMPTPPYEYGGSGKGEYQAPAWIPKGYDKLKASLPKEQQNGNSYWGELECPRLPNDGLPGGPSYPSLSTSASAYPTGYPHNGTKTSASTSGTPTPAPACPTMPDTGVTRTFDFNIAYQTIAPDGVTRNGLTINGQYPGPIVEANWYARFHRRDYNL